MSKSEKAGWANKVAFRKMEADKQIEWQPVNKSLKHAYWELNNKFVLALINSGPIIVKISLIRLFRGD